MAECDFRVVLSFLQLLEALHNPHLAVLQTVFCSTKYPQVSPYTQKPGCQQCQSEGGLRPPPMER